MSQYFGIPAYGVSTPSTCRGEGYSNGEADGKRDGLRKGRIQGWNDGWEEGRKEGWDEGWTEAVNLANIEISKQIGYVTQHVADKKVMREQLDKQHELILKVAARIEELERENARIKAENARLVIENQSAKTRVKELNQEAECQREGYVKQASETQGLRKVVTALKEANERLQTEVSELDEKYKERTKEYNEQVVNYNRNMVFMNAVRLTLEHLTAKNDERAKEVQEIFAQKYSASVSDALAKKQIDVTPEKDDSFGKMLPKTQKFILAMLSSVAANARQSGNEQTRECENALDI